MCRISRSPRCACAHIHHSNNGPIARKITHDSESLHLCFAFQFCVFSPSLHCDCGLVWFSRCIFGAFSGCRCCCFFRCPSVPSQSRSSLDFNLPNNHHQNVISFQWWMSVSISKSPFARSALHASHIWKAKQLNYPVACSYWCLITQFDEAIIQLRILFCESCWFANGFWTENCAAASFKLVVKSNISMGNTANTNRLTIDGLHRFLWWVFVSMLCAFIWRCF